MPSHEGDIYCSQHLWLIDRVCLARVFSSVFKESEDLIQARHGVAFDPVHPSRIGQRQRSLPHSSSAAPAVKREEEEDWGK